MSGNAPILTPVGYWSWSQRPLQALLFLAPVLLIYELALPYVGVDQLNNIATDIYARRLLHRFFETLGVTAFFHLPALIVVVVLFCWHLARHDRWDFRPRLYAGMWCESLVLALPLFVFQMVLLRNGVLCAMAGELASVTAPVSSWAAELVFAIGAGIYEELLFRLIAISLLHMVLIDVLALPKRPATVAVIGLSAIMFGLYHFPSYNVLAWDAAQWGRFVFYTGAGVYLAILFVLRGFGIVAATHAVYDVLVVLLAMAQHQQP